MYEQFVRNLLGLTNPEPEPEPVFRPRTWEEIFADKAMPNIGEVRPAPQAASPIGSVNRSDQPLPNPFTGLKLRPFREPDNRWRHPSGPPGTAIAYPVPDFQIYPRNEMPFQWDSQPSYGLELMSADGKDAGNEDKGEAAKPVPAPAPPPRRKSLDEILEGKGTPRGGVASLDPIPEPGSVAEINAEADAAAAEAANANPSGFTPQWGAPTTPSLSLPTKPLRTRLFSTPEDWSFQANTPQQTFDNRTPSERAMDRLNAATPGWYRAPASTAPPVGDGITFGGRLSAAGKALVQGGFLGGGNTLTGLAELTPGGHWANRIGGVDENGNLIMRKSPVTNTPLYRAGKAAGRLADTPSLAVDPRYKDLLTTEAAKMIGEQGVALAGYLVPGTAPVKAAAFITASALENAGRWAGDVRERERNDDAGARQAAAFGAGVGSLPFNQSLRRFAPVLGGRVGKAITNAGIEVSDAVSKQLAENLYNLNRPWHQDLDTSLATSLVMHGGRRGGGMAVDRFGERVFSDLKLPSPYPLGPYGWDP